MSSVPVSRSTTASVAWHALAITVAALFLVPLLWVVSASLRLPMAYWAAVGDDPRPATCGKVNHIQWLRLRPRLISARAVSKS